MSGLPLVAALGAGIFMAALSALLVRPTTRLGPRVRPYSAIARSSLGHPADVVEFGQLQARTNQSPLAQVFGPVVTRLARALSRLIDGSREDQLVLKLRHAGMVGETDPYERLQQYRVRQLASIAAWASGAVVASLALSMAPGSVVFAAVLGVLIGFGRHRGALDRAIDARRARMRIELYTINQLLAMHVRVGGGVIQALQRVVGRGSGPVIDDFAEVLRNHAGGMPARDALLHAADMTVEPHAARTYKVLAAGVEWGADLGDAMLNLSEDIRDARREAIKRAATRRRASMLVPIICLMAPVMLLFLAAPLPSIVFGR